MSVIRKIIGFLPVLIPVYLAWLAMSPVPATSEIYRTPLYRPADVPWFIWLWIVFSVAGGVMQCVDKLTTAGLIVGVLPYAVLAVVLFAAVFTAA